jgi:hypothetical protein
MRILDLRGSFTTRLGLLAVTTVTVIAVAMTTTPPAQADDGAKLTNSTHSTTTTVQRSTASDVFFVPTSYVDKMKHKCRVQFHHRHKRHICIAAQNARAESTKFFVTHYRVQNFWNLYKQNTHLAKKCRHHHHWCAHTPKFRHMTIANCGAPWAPPTWHFRASCLSWRASENYKRWANLAFYHTHTVTATTTATLRLANATIGPKDNTHMSITHGFSWFGGGPYTAVIFTRSATEQAYQQVWAADGAVAGGSAVCGAGGTALSAGLAIAPCVAMVALVIGKIKNDLTNAHNQGKCLMMKFFPAMFAAAPVTPPGVFFPTGVADCVTGKVANQRSK